MRWTKRLKWIRISKIVIPIALAISLVFAGFTVYAHKAEYFVLRIANDDGVNLALTMNRDLSGQTSRLRVPVNGGYEDATWIPDPDSVYIPNRYNRNLPNDIAKYDGEHSIYETRGRYSFYSFSFWLVNNSSRAVDVDMRVNIDSVVIKDKESDIHIDDAVRFMLIEHEPLLSDNTYVIYKKAEKNEENERYLNSNIEYGTHNTVSFASDICVVNREGDLGYRNLAAGDTIRFTVVMWLEGWDPECIDQIIGESLKMSIDFTGH
ncbi:MAG: hypothetical protein K2O62_03810 [Clostridia bacterium]|nr:hypothetical protein [Clostridia bacterium]